MNIARIPDSKPGLPFSNAPGALSQSHLVASLEMTIL